MARRPLFVAALLCNSGFAALVYQTTWFREFRYIFGASTYATAAVLATFMAGLGIGSALLGRVADRKERPLAWYGMLEIGIAVSAALSPLLIAAARNIYLSVGGSATLGVPVATLLRLLLTVVVLGIPTVLMGGTLPAAARAVETHGDHGRRTLALLYGLNTLGAVAGVLLTTFVLLERFGNQNTLLIAALLNSIVAMIAIVAGRSATQHDGGERSVEEAEKDSSAISALPRWHYRGVLIAAAVVGFAFFLMELVWYRMLGPLLGGSTFTFGLILAFALLGIGLGGTSYALWRRASPPTAGTFAMTCVFEALAVVVPFALGDRLAIFAALLRPLGSIGFIGSIVGWSLVTAIVVLPAAFIAGVQFPVLVALLGEGRRDVGRDVGAAYAWNTAGAIAGALAGGFGILPLLSAPGAWRLVTLILALLGLAAAIIAFRLRARFAGETAIAMGLLSIALTATTGPTAVWRHTGIGAGRASVPQSESEIRDWMHGARRTLVWEEDGRESSIAVIETSDRAFVVNGKIDGSARGDAATQVMGGLIGALIHPAPRSALVIGLGTGSTAGWLAAISSVDRVDAVELEPAVLRVARDFEVVNHGCMTNPKVDIEINDAREVLLTTPRRYDIIFSEPSNPYRAGIASLYTREFYRAASERLNEDGLFLQWVQTYEIDAETVRTIYATMTSVFEHVDTWRTTPSDLILIGSRRPPRYDAERMRARMREEPYISALHKAWRVQTLEGVLGRFVGGDEMARRIAHEGEANTDDRTIIEFGLARSVGRKNVFEFSELLNAARQTKSHRPGNIGGQVNWELVELNRWTHSTVGPPPPDAPDVVKARYAFVLLVEGDDFSTAAAAWRKRPWRPVNSLELSRLASVLAEDGSDEAEAFLADLKRWEPVEATIIEARLRMKQRNHQEAARLIEEALRGARRDAWVSTHTLNRAVTTAAELAGTDRRYARPMYEALKDPFPAGHVEDSRRTTLPRIARVMEGTCGPRTIAALRDLEPHVPWNDTHLRLRGCYDAAGLDALVRRADHDWAEFSRTSRERLLK